jgi:superoxide dismutase, Cu-Zn family
MKANCRSIALAAMLTMMAGALAGCSDDRRDDQPAPVDPTASGAPAGGATTPGPDAARGADAGAQTGTSQRAASDEPAPSAIVTIGPTAGSNVNGELRLEQRSDGVWITGNVTGLTPGEHGFHVHEKGDCSAHDASSAGGHFTGGQQKHGAPTDPEHHAGDLGNITADADGSATIAVLGRGLQLVGEAGIENRALIVHGGADDMTSQPSGNSGSPVGCGTIRAI